MASAIQWRRLIAFLITAAAHFSLIYVVFFSPSMIRGPKLIVPFADRVIDVRLIETKVAPSKPDRLDAPSVEAGMIKEKNEMLPHQVSSDAPRVLPEPLVSNSLPVPPPHYFKQEELGEKTVGVLGVPSELTAAMAGAEARSAQLRLEVNESGEVDEVIVDASNFSAEEQQLLIEAFQKKIFSPGKIDGQAVKSEISLEITVAE